MFVMTTVGLGGHMMCTLYLSLKVEDGRPPPSGLDGVGRCLLTSYSDDLSGEVSQVLTVLRRRPNHCSFAPYASQGLRL